MMMIRLEAKNEIKKNLHKEESNENRKEDWQLE